MGKQRVYLLVIAALAACGSPQEPPAPPEPMEQTVRDPEDPALTQNAEPEPADDAHALPTTIDGLVERFNGSHGLWLNGLTPTVELPETANSRAVLEEMFKVISFDNGPVTEFDVFEERTVQIDADAYTALRLTTNQGPKIVLIRYRSGEWWTRVYEGRAP